MSRKKAAGIVTVLCTFIGIFCSLSFCCPQLSLFGLSLFDLFDFTTGQLFLPIGGFLTCLFMGWYVPKKLIREEFTNRETLSGRFFGVYLFCVRYVCPVCILVIFLHQLGVV